MMIHYFNPGHETAVRNASKHYQPPAHVAKMQADLAFLPAWYASGGDYVFMQNSLPDDFLLSCEPIHLQIYPVNPTSFAASPGKFQHSVVDLWGISPQSVHLFEKMNERWKLSFAIPQWKETFCFLGSRFASQKLLSRLLDRLPGMEPEILPRFFSNIEAIEQQIVQSQDRFLAKSPYSSSGRGLLWLLPGKLMQSERQILGGMLKKQMQVSIEKVLDKKLDFSMQFEITTGGETLLAGYSIFRTNAKGGFEKNRLDKQEHVEKQITNLINADLLYQTQIALTGLIQEMYAPFYTGIAGVDMMVYQSAGLYRLHPCVEINMRKNMGYLAIHLAEKYMHPDSQGEFYVEYNRNPQVTVQKHRNMQDQFPLIVENRRIRSGYLSLCPITDATNYQAYVKIS